MRQNLVEIAETLLIEGGMAAVTADEVARRADVSLQTVYNRVGGKPALLIAIAERSMEENRAYVDKAYDGKGTPEERGLRIFNAYVSFAMERPHQFRILANPRKTLKQSLALALWRGSRSRTWRRSSVTELQRGGSIRKWILTALRTQSGR
ncbi:TetR/AcrR family transcriptional regulator [Pseudomonas aeruginosa]